MTADGPARSRLDGRDQDLRRVGARELAGPAQVGVRIDAREALGRHPISPPTVPNTWAADAEREWLWLGPDEWLVVGPEGTALEIVARLEAELAGSHHSVVDVSSARAVIELAGDARLDLLARGCSLDLHPRSWRPGTCAQTLLARVPVILQEREEGTRVFVRPSFGGYLVDWLLAVGTT